MFVLAAKLKGHSAHDEGQQHQKQGQIKTAEHRGIDRRKRGKQSAARGEQPDFIAVPEGLNGMNECGALILLFGKQVPKTNAEVKAVQDGITDHENADE